MDNWKKVLAEGKSSVGIAFFFQMLKHGDFQVFWEVIVGWKMPMELELGVFARFQKPTDSQQQMK